MALSDAESTQRESHYKIVRSSARLLLEMCEDHRTCRRAYIDKYYGIERDDPCDNCDVCNRCVQGTMLIVEKKFVDAILEKFRVLCSERKEGWPWLIRPRVSFKAVADSMARTLPDMLDDLIQTGYFSGSWGTNEDHDLKLFLGDRQKICRQVVQKLIIEGVFKEYYVEIRNLFRFYLEVSRVL